MNFQKNYYQILGVEKNASREQIKASYRKLVMQYHPDRNHDDKIAEEKMKEINEAYEILDSDISRYVYDEYKRNEERIKKEQAATADSEKAAFSNKKSYQKKIIITTERKIYVKGSITVKFWAEQESELSLFIMKEVDYKLNPVTAEAIIYNSDIHGFTAPPQFQKAYKEAEIFKTPLPSPVKCRIVTTDGTSEYYDLNLQDVRIINPVLSDLVKYDKQSLGTLTGEFYGYVLRIDEEEVIETVTECFGETGRTETKRENQTEFLRKEYYNKDCTTYWGAWIALATPRSQPFNKENKKPYALFARNEGCAQYWWIPGLGLFLFMWPKFFLGLILIALIGFLFSLGAGLVGRLLPALGLLFIGFMIYSVFKSGASSPRLVRNDFPPSYDTLRSTIEPIGQETSKGPTGEPDSLIRHYIKWKDYDSVIYSITLSVTAKDVRSSVEGRNNFEPFGFLNSLAPVYNHLEKTDQSRLRRIYDAFDSIQISNSLTRAEFAKVVVSCIQSIPYYLVVDQSCDPENYDDEFISSYLQQCNRECCVGNTKYGVRSPAEFIGDLKGDCDTRSLVIYTILKRFDYNVALLISQYYRHALIAVNFEDDIPDGLAMNINDKNYYLWETTIAGFRPGQIPINNRNLSYWNITLLNEKTKPYERDSKF